VPQGLVDWFFKRDVKFLKELSHLKTTPKLYDVDYDNNKIFIEWNKETLSQVLFTSGRDLDKEVPNWKEQMKDFFISTKENNFWKVSLYPNCFFISKDGQFLYSYGDHYSDYGNSMVAKDFLAKLPALLKK
jgi:hypothetical protein